MNETIRTSAYGGVRLVIKETSWSLRRPAPGWAAENLPAPLVETARQALTEGWKVEVVSSVPRTVGSIAISAAMIAASAVTVWWFAANSGWLAHESWPIFPMLGAVVLAMVGLASLMMGTFGEPVFLKPAISGNAALLAGRAVEGKGRASVDLWHKAIKQLVDGHRGRKSLVAIHAKLVEVADAEDLVDKLREASKYKPDTAELDAALAKAVALVAEATELVTGTKPALGTGPKPNNVWTFDTVLPEPELANADNLR